MEYYAYIDESGDPANPIDDDGDVKTRNLRFFV